MRPAQRAALASVSFLMGTPLAADVLYVPDDFATAQDAIDDAHHGDEVVLQPGVYQEHLDLLGKEVTLRSQDPWDDTVVEATVLSGDLNGTGFGGTVITCDSGETLNTRLAGLTIRDGGHQFALSAGGVVLKESSLTIYRCRFVGHNSIADAGAVSFLSSSSTLRVVECDFTDNRSWDKSGGALLATGGEVLLVNCRFFGNTATRGGAVYVSSNDCAVTIMNCLFVANRATDFGGGAIYARGPDGGFGPEVHVVNSTFVGNTADFGCSVTDGRFAGGSRFRSCVVWDNASALCTVPGGTAAGCIVGPQAAGSDTINSDPLFVDADGPDDNPMTFADNDYRPSPGSPAIDAGDNTALPPDVLDLDADGDLGEPVPIDLGGSARVLDDVLVADTGDGLAPLVDLGAYEYQPPPRCLADLDANGLLNVDDIEFFVAAFLGTDLAADCDANAVLNVDDIECFVAAFLAGCP